MNDDSPLEAGVFTIDELIDICLNPFHIDVNLLHVLLKIIASKLKLQSVRVNLVSPRLFTQIRNIVSKTQETIEGFRILEGGAQRPFKMSACKLERISMEVDPPTELLFRVSKKSSHSMDGKLFRETTNSPKVQDEMPAFIQTDVNVTNSLTIAQRLESCEVEIRKLCELMENINLKESEKTDQEHGKDHKGTIDEYLKLADSHVDRKEINLLTEKTADITSQIHKLTSKINDLRKDLMRVNEEIKLLSRTLESIADPDKVDYCFKEICNLQKKMAQNTDKISDIINCSDKLKVKNKELNDKLQELNKLKVLPDRVKQLEQTSQKTLVDFDVFTERLEHLKIVKSDREEMEYLLQFKANKEELHEMVSLELFNKFRYDISGCIDQSFENIASAEIKWKKCWYELQSKLEEKMDRTEKQSIIKLINQKVRLELEAYKGIKDESRSTDLRMQAAKNVNCVYSVPKADTTRRVQKLSDGRKRLCGGSHTIISPRKKVEQRRSAPIYSEANLEALDLIEGGNGKMYRAARSEGDCGKLIFPKVMYPSRKPGTWDEKPPADDEKPEITNNVSDIIESC